MIFLVVQCSIIIRNLRSLEGTYVPRITRAACTLFQNELKPNLILFLLQKPLEDSLSEVRDQEASESDD